mgnify:CR=1 FL=1
MTIQPSLIIWTVLCFIALYFILKYLLFRPILSVMDERNRKIEDARRAKEAQKQQLEEQQRLLTAARERAAEDARIRQEKEAEMLRLEGKEQLENAKAKRFAFMEEYRRKTDADFDDDMSKADSSVDHAADLFLSRLFES